MNTMLQLTHFGVRDLRWCEVPVPDLPDGDAVIVRPLTVASCDADGIFIHGRVKLKQPAVIGHEGEGVVTEVGDRVTKFRPGDRVIIPWKIACGSCRNCRHEFSAQCTTVPPDECYSWGPTAPLRGGFLSDAVVVPWADYMLTAMPANADPLMVCGVADNISDGWRTIVPHIERRPEAKVLVTGREPPGSIGLYAAGIAVALGAREVVYADHDPGRLAIAERLGASTHRLAYDGGLDGLPDDFDITVDSAWEPSLLTELLGKTGRAGVCTSVAGLLYMGRDVTIPAFQMYMRSITYHSGWVHTHSVIDGPLDLIARGGFDPAPVITASVGWEDAAEALCEPFTKVIIHRPV
jgi:threonine dehydrogenase-like Zn-dependent dehydrogenase